MTVMVSRTILAVVAACLILLSAGVGTAGAALQRSAVGPPVPGAVVRGFDRPATPYGPGHRGVDLAATPGDVVVAPLAGTVRFAGPVAGVRWVTLDHGGGLRTTFGPVQSMLPRGSVVAPADPVGFLEPAATHLDWGALLDGTYIDPLTLLVRWRPHLAAH